MSHRVYHGKIKAIVILLESERDINGNTYQAFRWINTYDGKQVVGIVDSWSMVRKGIARLHRWDGYYEMEVVLPKREFMRTIKGWPHAHAGMGVDQFIIQQQKKDGVMQSDGTVMVTEQATP